MKATKDNSPWEQYHITLLSHLALYWIWSMLDSGERLLVTGVCPPIFGSQHCCRFRNRMQLNIRDLRLNTLYNKLSFLFPIYIARLRIPNDVNPDVGFVLLIYHGWNANKQEMWEIIQKRGNGNTQLDGAKIDTHHTSRNGR